MQITIFTGYRRKTVSNFHLGLCDHFDHRHPGGNTVSSVYRIEDRIASEFTAGDRIPGRHDFAVSWQARTTTAVCSAPGFAYHDANFQAGITGFSCNYNCSTSRIIVRTSIWN